MSQGFQTRGRLLSYEREFMDAQKSDASMQEAARRLAKETRAADARRQEWRLVRARLIWMLVGILLGIVAVLPFAVRAAVIGLHTYSAHLDPALAANSVPADCNGGRYNDANPGVYVRSRDGWQIGGYLNSHCRTTVYAGHAWEAPCWRLHCAVGLFGAGGYPAGRVVPMVPVSARYEFVRLSYTPRVGNKASGVVHLSFEREH